MQFDQSFIKKQVLFIDRDGTIVEEPPIDHQLDSLDKFAFVPGAISGLADIKRRKIYEFVLASNQDGLGTGSFPEDTFWPPQNLMLNTLKGEGVYFDDILIDRSFPNEDKDTRKPGTGMFKRYLNDPQYDLARSFVIGDRETDVELAKALGATSIRLGPMGIDTKADYLAENWNQVHSIVLNNTWSASLERVTNETSVKVYLDLRGEGRSEISTGVPFFDHMLTLLASHARINLIVNASGDLPHHLIEDVGIVIGKALRDALGACVGINRYGSFRLPMDESLATVALDFSGRPLMVWDASFKYEQVEGMQTEMIEHFFHSIATNSLMTLNVEMKGKNDHHGCEAIFKSFARALREAKSFDGTKEIPSTKGVL